MVAEGTKHKYYNFNLRTAAFIPPDETRTLLGWSGKIMQFIFKAAI